MANMFESAGWEPTAPVLGPVPLAPLPGWSVSELLCWAERAPLTGGWLDALHTAARPGAHGAMLTEAQRLRLIRAFERIRQGADADFLEAVGLLAPQPCPSDPEAAGRAACPGGPRCEHDWTREDLTLGLRLSPRTACTLLMESRELTGRSAVLLQAVHDGRLPGYTARRIARQFTAISEDSTVALVLARVMNRVGTTTPGHLERLTALTIQSLRDPAEAHAAHQQARRAHTGITPGHPQEDGIGTALITATHTEIAELLTWARTITRGNRADGDTRTVGQRRLDALLTALTNPPTTTTEAADPDSTTEAADPDTADTDSASAATDSGNASADTDSDEPAEDQAADPHQAAGQGGSDAAGQGRADAAEQGGAGQAAGAGAPPATRRRVARRPAISLRLIMTADTLLGRTNDPAWLTGIGAIPAYLARQLAITPTALQPALTDTRGQLLNLGREHRFAPADLERHIKARDLTCTWPGCTRPSEHCDLDHIQPWSQGGRTDEANLHPLCKRHHRARDAGWTPHRNPDNTTTWTSPTGTSYTTLPPDPPGQTPPPPPPVQGPGPPGPPGPELPDHDPLEPGRWQPPPPPTPQLPDEPPF